MEKRPDVVRRYGDVEVRLEALPALEARDVVLASLKEQLKNRVIDFEAYQVRRAAYLATFLPPPEIPDIVA